MKSLSGIVSTFCVVVSQLWNSNNNTKAPMKYQRFNCRCLSIRTFLQPYPINPKSALGAQQSFEFLFAQRLRMLDAHALAHALGEVAPQQRVDRGSERHRDERTEARQRHVALRIPDVALRAQTGRAQFAAEHQRGAPFDQFVD